MSVYSEYFLNSRSSNVQLEMLEISHPNFTQVYYLVRNAAEGITVTHEDETEHFYTYVPMKSRLTGPRDDLEQILSIQLGDLGEIIPQEVDAVKNADGMRTKPTVIYRAYQSDDLTVPLYGPLYLELKTFNFTREGCTFEAKAPSLNVSKTGELYTISRFPMLRGLV